MRHFFHLNFWLVVCGDITAMVLAHLLAYAIRFEFSLEQEEWARVWSVLLPLVPTKLVIFHLFGLYRGMWRYTSLTDLLNVVKACALSGTLAVAAILFISRFEGFSRSVFIIDTLLTFLMVAGVRVTLRLVYHSQRGYRLFRGGRHLPSDKLKPLLVIGAGSAGEKLAREVFDNPNLPYRIVGFVDDQPGKIGRQIHGIPIYGPLVDLPQTVIRTGAKEMVIAVPSARPEQMSRIVEACRGCGVPYKTLPGIGEMINDHVSIRRIREVSYRDLLGRPPVKLEMAAIGGILKGKTVLVTGAGGTIGSELCRQIIRFKPGKLLLFDAGETNLYQIEMELLHEHHFHDYVTVLGKVQDRELLEPLFAQYRPAVVFHAAAYKHVPMVERNPWEGVYNNIFASRRLMDVSVRFGVERFILISTDKAVRPTNVMGASKRLTELIMQSHCPAAGQTVSTLFMAVRFGNVLGSSGSVIPLFKRQIEMGGPVTVTHPEMTRYFMSIEEATQLILQATSMGEGGEIFILEMGTPVRIAQMARDLIRLCGKEPDSEIEILYTGLRPGEKMYEELITQGEGIVPTGHDKIMVLRGSCVDPSTLEEPLARLKQLAAAHNAAGIKAELQKVIPEYCAQENGSILNPAPCRDELESSAEEVTDGAKG